MRNLVLVFFILCANLVEAYDFEKEGIYYNKTYKGLEVTQGYPQCYEGKIVIPEKVVYEDTEFEVCSIGYSAFSSCGITSLDIPMSVKEISSFAISGCDNLTSIVIPDGVLDIGNQAFNGCSNLQSVTIGRNVNRIGFGAFISCAKLSEIVIPDNVTSIEAMAFSSCQSLKKIVFGSGIQKIPYQGFMGCVSLESVVIPDNVQEIGEMAFFGCNALYDLDLRNGVITIGNGAFFDCNINDIYIPQSVKSISGSAFSGKNPRERIIVDVDNTIYDSRDNCNAIIETKSKTLIIGGANTQIPQDIVSIGNAAFSSCEILYTIVIPEKVNSIGDYAFYYCKGLKKIVCLPETPPSCANSTFENVDKSSCMLQVSENNINAYKAAEYWKDFRLVESTGLHDVNNRILEEKIYYDIQGHILSQPRKGLNIVKIRNGETKKVILK